MPKDKRPVPKLTPVGGCRCLYSVEFREEKFSETELPTWGILGNWASDIGLSRKLGGYRSAEGSNYFELDDMLNVELSGSPNTLLLLGCPRLNPCPELKEPAQIIRVSPGLKDLPLTDPVNEHCAERLLAALTGYPKEALLYAPVSRSHDHLVTLGD